MNITEEKKQIKELCDSFGDKKYAVIRAYLFNEANKLAGDKTDDLANQLHKSCNEIIPVIEHFTPEYFKE